VRTLLASHDEVVTVVTRWAGGATRLPQYRHKPSWRGRLGSQPRTTNTLIERSPLPLYTEVPLWSVTVPAGSGRLRALSLA